MPRMGGSSRDSFTNVDTAVGTIVWVRRRNGSWWPGRIISDAELSTANLLSPRSGTPVKLLGREDGSVDWYNIEKSKRVKPFRCGDFEDCIEKAKAVAGLPTKKREKYARREDAILHALELEKQQLECSSEFLESSTFRRKEHNHADYDGEKEVSTMEATRSRRRRVASRTAVSQDQTDSGNSQVYPEEDSGGLSSSGRGQEEQEWNPEDEEVEGLPRMRGLQDFGLRIAAGRGRRSLAITGYDDNVDSHQRSMSCVTQSGKCSGILNGTKVPAFTTKRKRTLTGPTDEGSLRKRDRRRPLTQVLESSAKFLSMQAEGDGNLMQLVDDDDALVEGNQTVGGMERMGVEFASLATEGGGEVLPNSIAGVADRTCCSISGHTSAECCDGGSFPSEEINQGGPGFLKGRSTELVECSAQIRKGHDIEQQKLKRSLRKYSDEGMYSSMLAGTSGTDFQMDWSNPANGKGVKRPSDRRLIKEEQTENSAEDVSDDNGVSEQLMLGGKLPTALVDVPVMRENNVQKESVPMVLLASRLTKRPVVGYPVVVEAIDDSDSDEDGTWEQEDKLVMWHTARRTARQRVSGTGLDRQVDQALLKQAGRKLMGSPLSVSLGNMRKNKKQPLQHKESLSKKLLKKVVQSSRKTRTLSSIACEQKVGVNSSFEGLGNNNTGGSWDGHDLEVKLEEEHQAGEVNGFGWPVATYVPVRVALSRIKAAVSGSLES